MIYGECNRGSVWLSNLATFVNSQAGFLMSRRVPLFETLNFSAHLKNWNILGFNWLTGISINGSTAEG